MRLSPVGKAEVLFLLQFLSWKKSKGIPARVFCLMTGFKNHVRGDIHRWVLNTYHALSFKRTWETDKGSNILEKKEGI